MVTAPGDVRALLVDNRAFRRLFAGHLVSVVGDALYAVAAMWLVWELTGSTYYTGLAGVLTRLPQALQALVGPVVDRAPLRRVLVASELAQGAVVLVVPLAALGGHLTVAVVLATMGLLALANQFANPAQVAAIPRLVEDERLVRANSLGTVAGQASRAVANAGAGVAVAAVGAVALYVLDAVTFAVAALLFLALRIPSANGGGAEQAADGDGSDDEQAAPGHDGDPDGRLARYLADLREGWALVAGSSFRHLLAASLLAGFLGGTAAAVLPAFADAMAGAAAFGALVAARNGGRFLGSVGAPSVESYPFGRVAAVGFGAAGLLWLAGVAAGTPLLTALLFGAAAVAPGVYNVLVGAVLQTGVPEDLLGRVRAVVGSAQGVVLPLGLAAGGIAGEVVAPRLVVAATGVGYLAMAAYYLAVPTLRTFPPAVEVSPGRFDVREPSA